MGIYGSNGKTERSTLGMRYILFILIFDYSIMEKTNIEYFNYYLKLFIINIKDIFPEYKTILEDYYSELLNEENCNNDKFVKRFMFKLKDNKNEISNKDNSLFDNKICILKNIDFCNLWKSEELSNINKEKIWEYIQTLYILGESIVSDSNKIQSLLENFKKLKDNQTNLDSMNDEEKQFINIFENLSKPSTGLEHPNLGESIDENFMKDGILGKLANELKDEIKIDDLKIDETGNVNDIFNSLMKGENSLNFMNLIQTVGQKIDGKIQSGELNQGELMGEAIKMMGAMQSKNTNLFQNMQQQAQSNPTRDRLKKKLEQKNNQ